MLVFLVLCAYLRTLQGAPLLPPHASSFVAAVDLVGRDAPIDPDCGGPQCRSVYSIVQSCLLTIFTCVWTSLHPNINGPRDSNWTCFKRKVVTMLVAVIAPEMVFLWALRQNWMAKKIAKKYNEKFAKSKETVQTKTSLWGKVMGWFLSLWGGIMDQFLPLSKETTRRGDGQSWTTTHGFFIQMGGFILYENGYPKQVLDYNRLVGLLQRKAIDAPTVTECDLQDRSKGDAISKVIVVLQTMWFVFQSIARAGQRLPLSELEVLTLAFAVMNVAIYAVWWNKPQGVGMAICVPLTREKQQIYNSFRTISMGEEPHELPDPPQPDNQHSNINLPLISRHERQPNVSAGEKHSWLQRMLQKDRNQHSTPVFFLLRLPYQIARSMLYPLIKIVDSNNISQNDLRVPMFYASGWEDSGTAILVASCSVGMIFGAIHLLAWASQFPSFRDLILWRVSATVLTVAPFLPLLLWAMVELGIVSTLETFVSMRYIMKWVDDLAPFLIPFYVISRLVVIIIALLAIHDPPRDVLRDVSWTSYIPHF